MIGDIIHIEEAYYNTAQQIMNALQLPNTIHKQSKIVIAIAGESGSGKSVTAFTLAEVLKKQGLTVQIVQQDDYFFLPPQTNHNARLKNLKHVGIGEVNLPVLQKTIDDFISGKAVVQKPLVDYKNNSIQTEVISFKDTQVLIVEGTYVFNLNNITHHIFINLDYKETQSQRQKRGRETTDADFIEQVLAIEHQLINPSKTKADIIVEKDYSVLTPHN